MVPFEVTQRTYFPLALDEKVTCSNDSLVLGRHL